MPVGVDKVANALRVTPRRVQQLVGEGMPRDGRGRYDLAKCMLWYIRYLQDALSAKEGGTGADTITATLRAERRRLLKAQADSAELDLSQKRGQLVPVDKFYSSMSSVIIAARQQLLAMPANIAAHLEGEDRTVIQRRLDEFIRGVLTSMAQGTNGNGHHNSAKHEGAGAATMGTASAPNGKPVGRK
jgi:phage terminase Nu1 subunit (DNA packaging protein)